MRDKHIFPKIDLQKQNMATPKQPQASISAGWPSPAADYTESQLNLHSYAVKNEPATFFMKAAGNAMRSVGIYNGDLLIVDKSITPTSGKVVIVALNGELNIKLLLHKNGSTFLTSDCEEVPEIDITHNEEASIWGVVTYVLHSL